MTAPTLTLAQLKKLQPCVGAFEHMAKLMDPKKKMNAAQARAVGITMDNIVWAAVAMSSRNPDVRRRVQLWLADCAAHVLHLYERKYRDERPRNAIAAARSLARGEITEAGWRSAWQSARSAARIADSNTARAAAFAAWAAVRAATWAASIAAWSREYRRPAAEAASEVARSARGAAMSAAIESASTARAANAAWLGAVAIEGVWQFDRLIAWLGDQEPTDFPLPVKTTASKAA